MRLLVLLACALAARLCAGNLIYARLPYTIGQPTLYVQQTRFLAITDQDKISTLQVFTDVDPPKASPVAPAPTSAAAPYTHPLAALPPRW
ncbi:uncharacterized protein LOC125042547 [Penaeus chinensis]|uniref:uncharacterized protein LOC125042547 n=1 Tax=Penaeus chinensis TaxID=139456 RepID=UPI001FB5732B|nr:uncharacterized protein LOC125042547 [Penaeus chinensis]